MAKVSRNLNQRKKMKNNFGFLRFLVIVLSFISLISRIIYCTFATWLTVTTFDCIPCANSTPSTNGTSDLFIAHHSSAVFKTVRALNVGSAIKSRPKRSVDINDSIEGMDNFSQFFTDIDEDIDQQNETSNRSSKSMDTEWIVQQIPNNSLPEKTEDFIESLLSKSSQIEDFLKLNSRNKSDPISSFFNEEPLNSDQFVVPVMSSSDGKSSNNTPFERFTYIPSDDLLNIVRNLTDPTVGDTTTSPTDPENNTMTVDLNESFLNSSKLDQNRQHKSLVESDDTNKTSNATNYMTKTQMNVCSEDCSQFLNIELSDPNVRKWATIVITGVLYLYAFVMFCIFISSCLGLVDLLVVSTFIEGAKLFAGFILIIIDSFNGKEIHFDLIDIKFNVSPGGNGWTADFSYSEYLLDIIIFFLSVMLSIRVFKCFERKVPKKVSSVEELVDTSRGTYRANHSRNSLEPIYEHN